MKQIILYLLISVSSIYSLTKYDGYKLITIKKLESKEVMEALVKLQDKMPELDFWSDPSLVRKTDIMVKPSEVSELTTFLDDNEIAYEVSIPDIQRAVDSEVQRRGRQQNKLMNWKDYQRLNTIYTWLDSLSFQNPKIVQVSSLGKSFEKRDIKMVKVSTGGYNRKPIIYIDAGIHAREWIGPATATYMLKELISGSAEYQDLLNEVDWYFVPVLNPDGYEYSHTEDRLWRKTRSTQPGVECVGVDANRNFDFHWGEEGVKNDPCANTYPGPNPFSEPEANATANFLYQHKDKIRAYITLHSYSQLWLTPYGYTEELPDDYDEIKELGDKAVRALEEVHGTEFQVGPPSQILYKNSGSSRDWAKGVADIKYPFTIELPDKGEAGFLLPPSEIQPTAEETWEAIKVVARQLLKDYPY